MSKSAKIWHSKLIFYVKNHRNLSQFFFLEKYQSRSTFFDNINFYITLFSKIVSNFWQLATTPILKIQSFPLGMVIFRQKIFPILYSPLEKFDNPYCHSAQWGSRPRVKANIYLCHVLSKFSPSRLLCSRVKSGRKTNSAS